MALIITFCNHNSNFKQNIIYYLGAKTAQQERHNIMDIYAKLKELLNRQIKRKKFDPESLTPETELSTLGLDSLDTAELIINIEEEFNLPEIDQDEMMDLKTIEDVKNLVEKKMQK